MKNWVALPLLLFIGYNIVLDSALADCHEAANVSACHACVCQTHMKDQSVSTPRDNAPAPSERMVFADPQVPQRLFDKFIFHPPKVSA
ncbi:MAG: hypothetical protein IPN19_04045 [Elusimicrobia bacterium]|nr:hypothetical protein [Elusimicrobiota bacterium]